jgi:YidC/Oxa1 family membrane protein insertase
MNIINAIGFVFSILQYPIGWCITELTAVFSQVGVLEAIGSYGLAIIATTLIIRSVLFPIFGWQLRTTRKVQEEQRKVAPEIQELRRKYRKEPQKLSAELQKVYAQHGISPFSGLMGCVPALVQMPVIIGLYSAIRSTTQTVQSNKGFLWIPDVSHSVHDLCCGVFHGSGFIDWFGDVLGGFAHSPTLLILPLITATATYMQSRMMMPPLRDDMTPQERSMVGMSRNLSYVLPLVIFMSSVNFAQGLALYWVMSTSFMVAQQYHLIGWGSLNVPGWVPGARRQGPLAYLKAPLPPMAGGVAGKNGKNGSAADATADGARRRPSRAERESVPVSASGMGQGRAPGRSPTTSKKKRRR